MIWSNQSHRLKMFGLMLLSSRNGMDHLGVVGPWKGETSGTVYRWFHNLNWKTPSTNSIERSNTSYFILLDNDANVALVNVGKELVKTNQMLSSWHLVQVLWIVSKVVSFEVSCARGAGVRSLMHHGELVTSMDFDDQHAPVVKRVVLKRCLNRYR